MKTNEYPLGWCIERGLPKPVIPVMSHSECIALLKSEFLILSEKGGSMRSIHMNGKRVLWEPAYTVLWVYYEGETLVFPTMARLERWVRNRVATKVDGLWTRPEYPGEMLSKAEMLKRVRKLFKGGV